MSIWVDVKYANLVSSNLDKFKLKSTNPYSASFRCPICGDSKKNLFKTRGGFFQNQDLIMFKCFNCGISKSLKSFLKEIAPTLYKEYTMENYTDRASNTETLVPLKKIDRTNNGALSKLKKISQLKWDHPAKLYVLNRKIPNEAHSRLYYCSKFATWTNTMIPEKLNPEKHDAPRLIIPFFDERGIMFGYQGRSFNPNDKARYISIMLRSDKKVFGLDLVDFNKKHYVVEGPIDSMFLPNCLAMSGADIDYNLLNDKSVVVYDNECRNNEIIKRMQNVLDNGYKLCIWPETMKYKDINDMVLGGLSTKKIVDIIDENTYNGAIGLMKLNTWKKI